MKNLLITFLCIIYFGMTFVALPMVLMNHSILWSSLSVIGIVLLGVLIYKLGNADH